MSVSTRQGAKAAVNDAREPPINNGATESPQPSQTAPEQNTQPSAEVDFQALFASLLDRVEQIANEVTLLRKPVAEDATTGNDSSQPRDAATEETPEDSTLGGDKQPETCLRSLYGKFSPPKIFSRYATQSIDQLESWLDINQIYKDRERFLLLKMSIEPETYRQVSAALTHKNPGKEYETLKNAIIQAYTDSEAKQIQNLLSGLKLGDRRPSQLLAEMCDLYKGPKDKIFEELFLSRLPGNVRGILVSMRGQDEASNNIETIAKWADTIIEQLNVPPMINAISETNQISALQTKLDNIINTFSNSNNRFKKPFAPKNKKRRNSNEENKENSDDDICYFHRKFGNNRHENRKCPDGCKLNKQWREARAMLPKN